MPEITEIAEHEVRWDFRERKGYLWLKDSGGNVYTEMVESPGELHFLAELLRNESPVFYHTEARYISTSKEPIGPEPDIAH